VSPSWTARSWEGQRPWGLFVRRPWGGRPFCAPGPLAFPGPCPPAPRVPASRTTSGTESRRRSGRLRAGPEAPDAGWWSGHGGPLPGTGPPAAGRHRPGHPERSSPARSGSPRSSPSRPASPQLVQRQVEYQAGDVGAGRRLQAGEPGPRVNLENLELAVFGLQQVYASVVKTEGPGRGDRERGRGVIEREPGRHRPKGDVGPGLARPG